MRQRSYNKKAITDNRTQVKVPQPMGKNRWVRYIDNALRQGVPNPYHSKEKRIKNRVFTTPLSGELQTVWATRLNRAHENNA